MRVTLEVAADDAGRRLDRILRKYYTDLPLSALHRLFRRGAVHLEGRPAEPSDRPAAGARISLPDPGPSSRAAPPGPGPSAAAVRAPDPPFGIVWEDDDWLVIDKAAGVLVHGPDSLEKQVADYLAGRLPTSLSFKPGPLHRLDRGTSGLIVFSKSLAGARSFSAALRGRTLSKRYIAVVEGAAPAAAEWRDALVRDRENRVTAAAGGADSASGGSVAVTGIRRLALAPGASLLLVGIATGLTHQIRAQAAAHGLPLSGDVKYGGRRRPEGWLLHAYELSSAPGAGFGLPSPLVAAAPPPFLAVVADRFGSAWADRLAAASPSERLSAAAGAD
jgi:23S rRNA pseudouridine955/2504/2580 synthase